MTTIGKIVLLAFAVTISISAMNEGKEIGREIIIHECKKLFVLVSEEESKPLIRKMYQIDKTVDAQEKMEKKIKLVSNEEYFPEVASNMSLIYRKEIAKCMEKAYRISNRRISAMKKVDKLTTSPHKISKLKKELTEKWVSEDYLNIRKSVGGIVKL